MKTKLQIFWSYFSRISPILMIIFLLLWLRACQGEAQQANRYEDNLKAKESVIRTYKLENGQLASEKDLLTVTNKELKDQVWMQDDSLKALLEKLKDPKVAIKWETEFVYKDTLYIPFDRPVEYDFERSFHKATNWYSVTGNVNQDGVSFRDVSIPNTQRLVVAYKKGKPVVRVTNSNPYIVTEDLEGQVIDIPKKHWVFGLGGTWNIYEPPSAGFFLGYKIFEF